MNDYCALLEAIDPARLTYDEWLAVGMALHHEGGTCAEWDSWSQRDTARHYQGECAGKWASFGGNATPVTMGTVTELAKRQGWRPSEGRAYTWNEVVVDPREDLHALSPRRLAGAGMDPPSGEWNGATELVQYLSALFESSEYVGYVTESYLKEGTDRYLPTKGSYTRTAGELISALATCGGDIGAVLGDYDPDAGAWIRFNPLDGQGVKDTNVTDFRYALVESDTHDIEVQAALYRELELPIAALVHSGGRSLHAIVRVDATSREEYRQRVNLLHEVCAEHGMEIDHANRNPSRLSRLPGVWRKGSKQSLVALNQGKATWEEWAAWRNEVKDNLPDFESLADVFDDLPALAPPLIEGVLREGHKLLLAGPSKAGKSFMLLQLVIAIAEGRSWLGWKCRQGRVLYVNLELDRASCLHRLKALYGVMNTPPENLGNIDLWNLRGLAIPMDALAPKLIRRAARRGYKAIIIDPIYKVITGDENAADKMAFFCNQFDRVCTELGAAVIYCHHHSKGAQGAKTARDRSSGSGVFARDPDALLDLIELTVSTDLRDRVTNDAQVAALSEALDAAAPNWRTVVSQDDAVVARKLSQAAQNILGPGSDITGDLEALEARVARQTGWRIEGTLREFAPFEPRCLWFCHPLHVMDTKDQLVDAKADGEEPPWKRTAAEKEKTRKDQKQERREALEAAFKALEGVAEVTPANIAEHMAVSEKTARRRIGEHPDFKLKDGQVVRTDRDK